MAESLTRFLRRINQFSTPLFGVGIELPPDERQAVLDLIIELGDRRVLWSSACGTDLVKMSASLGRIRESITNALKPLIDSPAVPYLMTMRVACQQFDTFL